MTLDPTQAQARIEAARQDLAQAQAAHDAAMRGLLASDGKTPIYQPAEHAQRVAELRTTLELKLASVDAQADGVIAAIESARLNPYADPVAALDLANHDLAARHRVFVAEDCSTLPVPELIGRLEWAGKSSAPYVRVLYARYGLSRFKRELDAQPQPDGIAELRAALEQLGAIGGSRGLSPELQNLRYAADGLKRAASYALAGGAKPTVSRMGI